MREIIIALALAIPVVSALAQTSTHGPARAMTAADLMEFCSMKDDTACRFFIFGAFEGLSLGERTSGTHRYFCLPADTLQSDMVKAVKASVARELAMFPEDRDLDAIAVIGGALHATYPCPGPSPPPLK